MSLFGLFKDTVKDRTRDITGFRRVQRLAYESVIAIGKELQEGWTEKQAAELIGTYLRDNGVQSFFHEPYAWFGDRSRFNGIDRLRYWQFDPTHRRLKSGDAVTLDVAPILGGYVGDIGYSFSFGKNLQVAKARTFLKKLRHEIPKIFMAHPNQGAAIWNIIDKKITDAGYDNIHEVYPYHVLGHRVRRMSFTSLPLITPFSRFSLHAVMQIFSDGFTSELLNTKHKGSLTGFWAIEPHIGGKGFGAKFEEILVVEKNASYWLDDEVPHI